MVEGGPTMGIKLSLDVETPLTDDDRDILAGISVMMLAVANRQNLAEQQMEMEVEEEEEEDEGEPMPCGTFNAKREACGRELAHPGRHKYRPFDLAGITPRSLN
jgi:hypothetical protein